MGAPGKLEHINSLSSTGKKICWGFALMLSLFCGAYWLKCQAGINIFNKISISTYFPFSYLVDDVLQINKPGVVFYEDFDHPRIFSHWSNSVLPFHSRAIRKVTESGFGDHSRGLQIASEQEGSWSYPFQKYILVTKGDVFYFEGFVYLEDASMIARLCIAAFDSDKHVIDWGLALQSVEKTGAWIKVQKQFTIADDRIRYISFQLTGARGVYRFDNLLLSKLNGSNT